MALVSSAPGPGAKAQPAAVPPASAPRPELAGVPLCEGERQASLRGSGKIQDCSFSFQTGR